MKRILRNIIIVVVFALHVACIGVVNFVMPSYKALNIVGTEVKRMGNDGFINKEGVANGSVRDVYFIYTKFAGTKKVIAFRNEDTRWGFPFYMKFNSTDLQAKATAFAKEKVLVQIKYYGWQIPIFDEFFNVISIEEIKDVSELSNPVFSYIFYILIAIYFVFCIIFIRRKFS